MKHSADYAPPRRLASPKKQVRLDLRRQPSREPDDEKGLEPKSAFWKWVGLVALFHVLAIALISLFYEFSPKPAPPPETFMSLLPPGDVVKGTAGEQAATKVGPSTPAPSVHHQPPPPPSVQPAPKPAAVVPPPPVVTPPPVPAPPPVVSQPVVQAETAPLIPDKPTPPKPVAAKPVVVKPRIKVDLTLADGPTSASEKPAVKPKPVHKKPATVTPPDEANAPETDAPDNPASTGLSKEDIAAKLGQKLQAAGVADAVKIGPSGTDHSQANPFADFYLALRDQVMSKWEHPNLTDETAVNPEVMIHVEKDGRVPPEGVTLTRSSGNQAYDDSALAAARSIGYTLQPLPDGCPPDISITFKLTR